MMKLDGKLTICRTSGSDGSNSVRVEIVDAGSGIAFVSGEVSMHDFAMAVTGHGYMPIALQVRGLDLIGKLAEHKSERIAFPHRWDLSKEEREPLARAAVAPLEVDGWIGDWSDLFNSHNLIKGEQAVYRVSFHRWVDRPDA